MVNTVDEHIAAAPAQARPMLEELRAIIRAAAPEATERISYGIPTFDLVRRIVEYRVREVYAKPGK